MNNVLEYFNQDSMAADTWVDKYQMKDLQGQPKEDTPDNMHLRMAKEFAKIEVNYRETEFEKIQTTEPTEHGSTTHFNKFTSLSPFGQKLFTKRLDQTFQEIVEEIHSFFYKFSQIVPQGSIMANLGNIYNFGSLSNCFGVAPPEDSYGGILRTDEEIAQLMKRRGGVGLCLDPIRPTGASVSNASRISTGVPTYAERYSNTTREVAQEGRRGALIELLAVQHPDIFRFVTMKEDRSKVTGANVSVKFTNIFMKAVEADEDFLCRFPVDVDEHTINLMISNWNLEYNKLYPVNFSGLHEQAYGKTGYVMKIRAKELFLEFVNMAHSNAEPGAAYIDTITDYAPDGVYTRYVPNVCNPCGEQWFHHYDTCRLIAQNFFGVVKNPFTSEAEIDYDLLYEVSYMQQRLGDDLVDLEVEHIDRIINKILNNDKNEDLRKVELELWQKIRTLALAGRRTGSGLTALGDMLAGILKPYYSPDIIRKVMKTKMRAELDCTIDMAILRGTFEGWDKNLEFEVGDIVQMGEYSSQEDLWRTLMKGKNTFFQMIVDEFPLQAFRMWKYGRRNVSWSTVAPGGSISIMTQTTSGLEPLFKAYYIRRKKINPNDAGTRVDFTDDMGDTWQEYPVLHPKFKEWAKCYISSQWRVEGKPFSSQQITEVKSLVMIDGLTKVEVEALFKLSPWYGSQAEDIAWQERIEINSIIQRYTSNALSCTINLPKDISQEVVYNIYMQAWKAGLKGITIYREGSRSGVLITETRHITTEDEFGYNDAIKRPKELDADYHYVVANGQEYAVIVGKLNNNPYEVFAFPRPIVKDRLQGKLVKVSSGVYDFVCPSYNIKGVNVTHPDEKLVTRSASLMLRHGVHPKYVVDQVEKSETYITSFPTAVARVLKKYIPDENVDGEVCPSCEQPTMIREEGCKKCTNCGYSKC